ncbi:MAG: ATP-binding protein [Deltaproteobacteria bacterium]|nr:ATP-binding protein [Deltaproteobacteria bacterium]
MPKRDKVQNKKDEHDRIAEIRVAGMRSIELVVVRTDGLAVLLGENGSGKSTIVEACELLRKSPRPDFLDTFHRHHAGFNSLGSDALRLGVTIVGRGPALRYDFSLLHEGIHTVIESEELRVGSGKHARPVLVRTRSGAKILSPERNRLVAYKGYAPEQFLLPLLVARDDAPYASFARTVRALEGIEVHLPFEVLPYWSRKAYNRPSGMRGSAYVQPTDRVELLGNDLANAFYQLKNARSPEHWRETLEYIKLGLGDEVEDVSTEGDPGGGEIALNITFSGQRPEPATAMSDGMLAYLALIAVLRLENQRSLLVFDEPDLHLHPHLLRRVVDFFETTAKGQPVLIATQSDQFLDALANPSRSAHICRLDDQRRTRLYRLDASSLERWLKRYRGIGELRSEGYEDFVLGEEES